MNIKIQKFLGIEFSISNQNRWQPSKVKTTFSNHAHEMGSIAPQRLFTNPITGEAPERLKQNEECLNLNIFASVQKRKLPVMVWIHGGGFQGGSGSLSEYEGSKLANAGNVVVVSINYRLACLGFLRLCDLSNGEIPSTGNEGLGDQITALKWIQNNIHHFGGDKNNVTLFGESAGAMSIACLLASSEAHRLFHKAILQSGAGHTYSSIEKANNVASEFVKSANQLGFTLEQLPSLSSEKLLEIQTHFLARPEIYQQFGILPFTPVIEEQLLPLPPHDAIAKGSAKNIAIIAGTNTDEWTFFASLLQQNIASDEVLRGALSQLIEAKDIDKCLIQLDMQLNSRNRPINDQNLLNEMYTEFWFTQPCHRLLRSQQQAGGTAYRYKLGRRSPQQELGCTHAADIGYVFGTTNQGFHGQAPRVLELVNEIQKSWAAFSHHGSPTTPENPWPIYDENLRFMMFDHEESYLSEDTYTIKQSSTSNDIWKNVSDQKLASF